MADDRPGGDWRHGTGGGTRPSTGAAKRPAPSRKAWQPGGPETPNTPRTRSRGLRLLVATTAAVALIGLAAWVVWMLWPARYPQLAIASAEATHTLILPADIPGANAAAEYAAWAAEGQGKDRPRVETAPAIAAGPDGPKIAIDPNAANLLLFITAPGAADANGAYVWVAPPKATSASQAQKVHVRDILDRIKARNGKPTVLVFDSTRVAVSWPHGMLFNDFARGLRELDEEIAKIPNLVVICASDADQRSWVFEERRMSVFSYFLLEALRGNGHDPGKRVTALSAYQQVRGNVERWAIGNRGERQVPMLLPQVDGERRAKKIDLALSPAGGYTSPAATRLEPPGNVPDDLEKAWATAAKLAAGTPPPEATNPALWKAYLDTLLRWEHLFRLGSDTAAVQGLATSMAAELSNPRLGAELDCMAAAIPAGRALGRRPVFENDEQLQQFAAEFELTIWKKGTTPRAEAWDALLKKYPNREAGIRAIAADQILVLLARPLTGREQLANAEAVVATVFPPGVLVPAELHFVRMLNLHLHPTATLPDKLLPTALLLRRLAERDAWLFGTLSPAHPYSEVVFRWVQEHIEKGDGHRHRGQDLLFPEDPAAWAEAGRRLADAETAYSDARRDGWTVASALASRDKVLARMPYYARWLASYRGNTIPAAKLDELLQKVETAAQAAHDIGKLIEKAPPTAGRDKLIAELERARVLADGAFEAIESAFDAEVRTLPDSPLPSNWHDLDTVLTVPFMKDARRRIQLLDHLRRASYKLAVETQQPDGSNVAPPQPQIAATRHARMALAFLGETSPERRFFLLRPDNANLRAGGDMIGTRFRGLAEEARQRCNDAVHTKTLAEVGPHLAQAAFLALLADPAAPMPAGFDPISLDRRFRRHDLLLWQAARTTTEGWAAVKESTSPDGWYCRSVSGRLIDSAEELMREVAKELALMPVESMTPPQRARWLSGCSAERDHKPVFLQVNNPRLLEIDDRLAWDLEFPVGAGNANAKAIGFPVAWLAARPTMTPRPEAAALQRQVLRDFDQGRALSTRKVRFTAEGSVPVVASPVTGQVLYRGHVYGNRTEMVVVGAPTREVFNRPPRGEGAMAIRSSRGAVNGAVTILIDLTESMLQKPGGSASRLEELHRGLEQILRELGERSPGTTVTLAYFYGTGAGDDPRQRIEVEPLGKPTAINELNWKELLARFKAKEAVGKSSPIAGAIREVLGERRSKEFWPANFTGSRTLIVLTDGADNWGAFKLEGRAYPNMYGGKEPGTVALDALLSTPDEDDVHLHMVFFALTDAEETRALKQFESLEAPQNFNDPKRLRTPGRLHPSIRDGDALAREFSKALLPRFIYRYDGKPHGQLEASLPNEAGGLKPTPPLGRGIYKFWGLKAEQSVEVLPGDRLLFQAEKRGDRFELLSLAYGYEVVGSRGRPVATTDPRQPRGLRGGLAAISWLPRQSSARGLSMTTTMEPFVSPIAQPLLEMPRAQFAWWEVNYPGGSREHKGFAPAIRVENRVEDRSRQRSALWAPAWDVTVTRWASLSSTESEVPTPVVTGYWIEAAGFPTNKEPIEVNLADVAGSWKPRGFRVGEVEVQPPEVSIERYSAPGFPEGDYLTVRLKYTKPGDLVYARPVNVVADQRFELYEQHTYYDGHARYTARFGPLPATDRNRLVKLDLYSVAELKAKAEKDSRAITLTTPPGPLNEKWTTVPEELEVVPNKK